MSKLLDAIAGIANAAEPLPGLLTGGQPQAAHLTKLKQAGGDLVVDIRDPMEPRPIRVPDDVRAAGLEYINIPVGHTRGDDATLDQIRAVLRGAEGKQNVLFHCASGNRSAAVLIPYLMLDQQFTQEDAVDTAMRLGMRSAELMEWALDYVNKQRGS